MIKGIYINHSLLSKVLIFLGFLLVGFGLSTIIGFLSVQLFFGIDVLSNPQLLTDFSNPEIVKGLKLMQFLHSIGIFIFPVLAFAYTMTDDYKKTLSLNSKPPASLIGFTVILMFVSLPIINFLVDLNGSMQFPEILKEIENWMRSKEDSAEVITKSFLVMESPVSYIFNLIVIGLIPAIGEELLFRGFLQKQLTLKLGNYHYGIWIAAFVFSAIHMQFYGFLPRFILGALFGYLFIWSGSLWIPILAHFINNAGAVTVQYIYGQKYTEETIDSFGTQDGDWFFLLLSCLLFFGLIFLAWRNRKVYKEVN